MQKYIHYCWFGDKPLPKLAKKCLKSWKKYLPDYKIMKWSEENVNLEECPFVKQAYENKKWAYVADYARAKAMYEYGGIYFDTDMEVTKDISHLLDHSFLGIEDSGSVAVGVWNEVEAHSEIAKLLLETYQNMESFDTEKMASYSIPILISSILRDYGVVHAASEVQELQNGMHIYPRDYFYPYSYNRDDNIFTDNTCMIHYYDASWVPFKDRVELNMVRTMGQEKAIQTLVAYRKMKHVVRKTAKCILFPVVLYRSHKRKALRITEEYVQRVEATVQAITQEKAPTIVIYNQKFLGVASATKELFDHLVDCGELYRKQDVEAVGNAILESSKKQLIFSSFSQGHSALVTYVKKKNPSIKIKTFWHGNHSQIDDYYGWDRTKEIIHLHKQGYIDVMGTCKKSLMEFYQKQGYHAFFIDNRVQTDVKPVKKSKDDQIRIGLYAASCDYWRKNMYTQMASVSLLENAVIDMVPLNEGAKAFAKILNLTLEGMEKPIAREELLKRLSQNSVNLYVTFSECAPMVPLESFEMGVPCVTGNNFHYFKGSELEKHIVVNNEENPEEIRDRILDCIENKDKIMKLYKEFKKNHDREVQQRVTEFLEM